MQYLNRNSVFRGVFFIFPFLYGLYYEFSAILAGIFLCLFLLWTVWEQKTIYFCKHKVIWILAAVIAWYGVAAIYGIDSGMAFLGFLKKFPLLLFGIVWMQFSKEEKEKIWRQIPWMGSVMTVFSAFGWLIPAVYSHVFVAGRMSGCFQYANTFACFLLLGLICLFYKQTKVAADWGCMAVLIFGILCSGSRTVMLLLLLVCAYVVIQRKAWKYGIGAVAAMVVLGILTFFIPALEQTAGRLFTSSIHASTMLGRFLYMMDALKLLKSHFFGMGAGGYEYVQGTVATGFYQVRYVHNDFLQIGLDIGVIPMIIVVGVVLWGIITCKDKQNRLVLLVLALHGLVDIDMEYMIMPLIFLMAMPVWEGKEQVKCSLQRKKLAGFTALTVCVALLQLPFLVATVLEYNDRHPEALAWYPAYTQARENYAYDLQNVEDIEDVQELRAQAQQLVKTNIYSRTGYQMLALCDYVTGNYASMMEQEEKAISLLPFYTEEYETYATYLISALAQCAEEEQNEETEALLLTLENLPEKMKERKNKRSNLGKQIKDQPSLELSKDVRNDIKTLKQMYQ